MGSKRMAKFVREGLLSTKRNAGTAAGTAVTIFLSLFLVGGFYLGTKVVESVLASVEEEVGITAYISDSAGELDIRAVQDELSAIEGVKSVTLTTKEEALENFKNTISSSSAITSQLGGANPLPASYTIELYDGREVADVAKRVLANEYFQAICDSPDSPNNSIKYGQQTVDKLLDMTGFIRWIGIVLVLFLIFIAFAFMNNTMRLSIGNRHKEIEIQKLVGASNGYIKGPFVAEGLIHALAGSLLAIIVLALVQAFVLPSISASLEWLPVGLPTGTLASTFAVMLLGGLFIGFVSSEIAVWRHLRKL